MGWLGGRSDLLLEELPAFLEDFLAQTAPWEKSPGKRNKTAKRSG